MFSFNMKCSASKYINEHGDFHFLLVDLEEDHHVTCNHDAHLHLLEFDLSPQGSGRIGGPVDDVIASTTVWQHVFVGFTVYGLPFTFI